MKKAAAYIILILLISFQLYNVFAVQRFPKPEFESGYVQPSTLAPNPRAEALAILDIVVLFVTLSVATWMIIKKRSRDGVFWISIFTIAYFGFFREGCICSVGSVQNIVYALFNPAYSIPISVILFFALPIIFTLFFGRTFCAGVCPLGAIQDVFVLRPVALKSWVLKVLGLIPFIYLGLAILYAATATDFIICRYDPFVGFFRLNASFMMFMLGGVLLLLGVFIARPYCRFLCPYGVLLNLASRVSRKHLSITPAKCIQCKLCEDSCPFGAIDKPVPIKEKEESSKAVRRIILLTVIIPLLVLIGGYVGSRFHENLASVNHDVRLAQELLHPDKTQPESFEVTAFKSAGKSVEEFYKETASIVDMFYIGGWILGGFLGLVFGLTLTSLSIFKYQEDYTPNKGTCLSCARCIDFCPVKLEK
ncbi:MAG: 4Fe-4S binding protein [Bacteroidales bacterium]|nr:MAG: 4Fe-4S binding protein [Bacteroidales bacterium]